MDGGYNSLFASADSFLGSGAFGTSAGTVKQLANGLAIDAPTFGTMPQFAQDHMASVGVRHGQQPPPGRYTASPGYGSHSTLDPAPGQ